MPHSTKPEILVIGGGFAGMACVRALRSSEAEITLVDRRPLLTCDLSSGEANYAVSRSIHELSSVKNIEITAI